MLCTKDNQKFAVLGTRYYDVTHCPDREEGNPQPINVLVELGKSWYKTAGPTVCLCTISSVVEHSPDKRKVTGAVPVWCTIY